MSLSLGAMAPALAETVDNTKEADALFLQGREALAAGDFPKACELFFGAQEKQRENPAILINLGLCNEKQDKLASALKWYRKTQLLTQGKTNATNKEYEDTARAQVNALQSQVSKVTFALGTVQPNAELLIEGVTINRQELIVEVDKGKHTVEARLPGMTTSREELIVEDNGKQLTFMFKVLSPVPGAKSSRKRKLVGAAIGGGVIAVASVVSGIWASGIKKDFDDAAGNPDKQQSLKEDQIKPSLVFVGGLAVGVGIAAYFFFTTGGDATESNRTALTPTVSNDGFGVSMFRRF